MSIFDLVKKNSCQEYIEGEIENKDLLIISYAKEAPPYYEYGVSAIQITLDENGQIRTHDITKDVPDPSTIYACLPVSTEYQAGPLVYFPNYRGLDPGQRFKYLTWLRNVDNPIDIGYVFLYYYGLERQLLIGNFDKAFDQIVRLRNHHMENKSFLKYSEAALIHSAIMKNSLDKLIDINDKTEISGFSNAQFLIAHNLGLKLSARNLSSVFYKAFTLSRKAIKENHTLFIDCIESKLTELYNNPAFPIKDYDISKTRTTTEVRFANYTFPKEVRFVQITDFYQCGKLMKDLEAIFTSSYEMYKVRKKELKEKLKNKTEQDKKEKEMLLTVNKMKELAQELYELQKQLVEDFDDGVDQGDVIQE